MFPFQPHPDKQERGQVLVMVAVLLVILVGFAGVAIDGGNLYTEQRRAQAAADNAVLAAAFAQMKGTSDTPTLRQKALDNAAVNAYNNNSTDNWVTFHRPPLHGGHAGDSNYMEVVITRSVQTALVHFVYRQNPVAVTVFAVAHGKYSEPVMAGFAIATFNDQCQANVFRASGNGNAIIKDGGIFINANPSCANSINIDGNNIRVGTTTSADCPDDENGPYDAVTNPSGCYISGEFPIQISGGQSNPLDPCTLRNPPPSRTNPIDWWVDDGDGRDNCKFYPNAVQTSTTYIPPASMPSPITTDDFPCDGPNRTTPNNGGTVQPGTYYDGLSAGNNDTLFLNPGVYCIMATNGQGKVLNAKSITGHGVFIYVAPTNALLNYTGGSNDILDLSAPRNGENGLDCTTDPNNPLCNVQGFLYYKPNGPNQCASVSDVEINFGGQGTMIIRGLIWAPKSFMDYNGQGNLYMSGQAMVGCARFTGSDAAEMDITYNPDDSFVPPPSVQLDN